jgi:hypothetical protein
MELKNVDPNSGNVAKENSKLLKLSPQTRFKVSFQKEMPLVPIKHHMSYLSLH